MIARADVGDNGNLATIKSQSFAQEATSGSFKHSCIDIWVHQNIARTARAAAIAIVNLSAIDIHTVGVGHAHAQLVGFKDVGCQPNSGGFTIGAGHCNNWNSAVVTVGVHVVNDGLANVSAFAKRWTDVHAQARRSIDFHNATILFFERLEN